MSVLELRGVGRTYPTRGVAVRALGDVDLLVCAGEYIAITGPSGSGKSTLMNIVGCLDTPTSGTYRLCGQFVHDLDEPQLARTRNRTIGFVFQSFHLLARTTALRNVELPLSYARVPAKERTRRALAALERVGLAQRAHHRPAELSGGERQRVAIARALVSNPELILADEPTGNLDDATASNVLGLLDALHEAGKTIVLVTHDRRVASRAARRIQLEAGRIVRDERTGRGAAAR